MAFHPENIDVKVHENGVLVLRIDLNCRLRDSQSGKSVTIATTGGRCTIPGRKELLSVNVFIPKKYAGATLPNMLKEVIERTPNPEHKELLALVHDAIDGYPKNLMEHLWKLRKGKIKA